MNTDNFQTITIIGRLRKTKGLVIYIAFVVFSVPLYIQAIRSSIRHLSGPDIGLFVSDELFVDYFDYRWPGVRRGDRVIAIDNQRVFGNADIFRIQASHTSPKITIRFARGEKTWSQSANTSPWPNSYIFSNIFRLISGFIFFLIGFIVFLLRPGTKASWLFMLFCYNIAILTLSTAFLFIDHLLYYMMWTLIPLLGSIGLHLFVQFPRQILLFSRKKWLSFLLYVPPVLLAPITLIGLHFKGTGFLIALSARYASWCWCERCGNEDSRRNLRSG